jgi:hypothetical protein
MKYDAVHVMLHEYFGLVLPEQFVTELVEGDSEILEEVTEGATTDTCVRDLIIDSVAFKVCGMCWPINGDTDEYKQKFLEAFDKSIAEMK